MTNNTVAPASLDNEQTKLRELNIKSFILFTIIGLVLVLNQFGDIALHIFPDQNWLHSLLEPLLNVNKGIDQRLSVWLSIAVTMVSFSIFMVLRSGLKKSFGFGFLVGLLTLPILVILGCVVVLIGYIIIKLIGWIIFGIAWLLTPIIHFFGWLLKPILVFFYKVYLWMKPVLQIIAYPFIWFFSLLTSQFSILTLHSPQFAGPSG